MNDRSWGRELPFGYDFAGSEREGYRFMRTRISTSAPTADAYFSMVLSVGRVREPLSRREIALLVVHILAATSACVMPVAERAATRSSTSTRKVRSALSARACSAARV